RGVPSPSRPPSPPPRPRPRRRCPATSPPISTSGACTASSTASLRGERQGGHPGHACRGDHVACSGSVGGPHAAHAAALAWRELVVAGVVGVIHVVVDRVETRQRAGVAAFGAAVGG